MTTRPFIDTLRAIESGILLDDLADKQQEIVDAVRNTHKVGEIVIKLTYRPEGNVQLSIEADVKTKVPKLPRGKSIFFITPEANLQRDDPRQERLDLRPAPDDRPASFKTAG